MYGLLSAIDHNDAQSTIIPMIFCKLFNKIGGVHLSNSNVYRRIMGSLKYHTLTRTNISFIVKTICQFLFTPTKVHQLAAKCLLKSDKLDVVGALLHIVFIWEILWYLFTLPNKKCCQGVVCRMIRRQKHLLPLKLGA